VEVVTGDRDLFQLVRDDQPARVIYIARGVGKAELIDEAAVTRKYGIPGRAYADFAVLRGDPSDGLPGVPGVGDKTAAALITRFGSLDAIVAALDAGADAGFPAGSVNKLRGARDYLVAAEVVVATRTDVPVGDPELDLPTAVKDPTALLALIERYGLGSPVARMLAAMRISP
jgi:5'-3' exonuclease